MICCLIQSDAVLKLLMTLISDTEHITAIEVAHFGMTGHGSATPMIAKRVIPMFLLNCSPFYMMDITKRNHPMKILIAKNLM